MAGAVRELGTPFLVHKRFLVAEPAEHRRERFAIFHDGFRFLAMLMALPGIMVLQQALVSQHPALAVAADAQDGSGRAQTVVGRIKQHVALEGTRRLLAEAERLKLRAQRSNVCDAKLDLDLDRLHTASIRSAAAAGPVPVGRWPVGNNGAMASRTLRLTVAPSSLNSDHNRSAIEQAAAILRAGGTVAFPTETVYGLGANALDSAAVAKIFAAKQRPSWDPLIVHVADRQGLAAIVTAIPEPAALWLHRFTPGPLTLLLPRASSIPDAVTAGRPLVAVRIPAHPVAQALLRASGVPIAAPSANLFGHVSPTTAAHVLADLDGRIDAVLDGGPTEHGLESTVVDPCASPCLVYRPGAVTLEQLAAVWPAVALYQPAGAASGGREALPAPGVGLRHYAPRARLILVEYGTGQAERFIAAVHSAPGQRTGVLLPSEFLPEPLNADPLTKLIVMPWATWSRPDQLAHGLFAALRALDDAQVERIVCPLPAAEGMGTALCDRLRKAARPK